MPINSMRTGRLEPARRERLAHLQTAKAAIAEGTEPMTTWRAPGFF